LLCLRRAIGYFFGNLEGALEYPLVSGTMVQLGENMSKADAAIVVDYSRKHEKPQAR
jgi:hypothetical protein